MEAEKNIGRYLEVMSTTDCSEEEGMQESVHKWMQLSLRCLDLSIRKRNMKTK